MLTNFHFLIMGREYGGCSFVMHCCGAQGIYSLWEKLPNRALNSHMRVAYRNHSPNPG